MSAITGKRRRPSSSRQLVLALWETGKRVRYAGYAVAISPMQQEASYVFGRPPFDRGSLCRAREPRNAIIVRPCVSGVSKAADDQD